MYPEFIVSCWHNLLLSRLYRYLSIVSLDLYLILQSLSSSAWSSVCYCLFSFVYGNIIARYSSDMAPWAWLLFWVESRKSFRSLTSSERYRVQSILYMINKHLSEWSISIKRSCTVKFCGFRLRIVLVAVVLIWHHVLSVVFVLCRRLFFTFFTLVLIVILLVTVMYAARTIIIMRTVTVFRACAVRPTNPIMIHMWPTRAWGPDVRQPTMMRGGERWRWSIRNPRASRRSRCRRVWFRTDRWDFNWLNWCGSGRLEIFLSR